MVAGVHPLGPLRRHVVRVALLLVRDDVIPAELHKCLIGGGIVHVQQPHQQPVLPAREGKRLRVRGAGRTCTQPYSISILTIATQSGG